MSENSSDIRKRGSYRLLAIIYILLMAFFIWTVGWKVAVLFTLLVLFIIGVFILTFKLNAIVYWLGKPRIPRFRKVT